MRNRIGIVAAVVALLLGSTALANAQEADLQITTIPHIQHVNDNGVIIQWSTNIPATALVRYGSEYKNLDQVAESAENGQTHTIQLHNLRSGTTYFYQVVSSANGLRAMTYVEEFVTSGHFVPYYTEPSSSLPR
jgi:hypothetical protein